MSHNGWLGWMVWAIGATLLMILSFAVNSFTCASVFVIAAFCLWIVTFLTFFGVLPIDLNPPYEADEQLDYPAVPPEMGQPSFRTVRMMLPPPPDDSEYV